MIQNPIGKLKEIIDGTGWSQAKVAAELGVSPKTLNFWLNRKSYPSIRYIDQIGNLYRRVIERRDASVDEFEPATSPDITDKVLQGILLEETEKIKNDKAPEVRKSYKIYYDGKMVAQKLEEDNYSRVIFFPSVTSTYFDPEWYKIGGNSALFYKYYLGPRMGKKPRIMDDTDLRMRFRNGVVMINMQDKYIRDLEGSGCPIEKGEFGLIFVTLDKTFTKKEVEEMIELERIQRNKIQRMIVPKENLPDVYAPIRNLARTLPSKIKKMDGAYRDTFGRTALEAVCEMYRIYFRMGNGRMEKREGLLRLFEELDNVTAMLAVADENRIFNLSTRIRIGENLVDLKSALQVQLNKLDERA